MIKYEEYIYNKSNNVITNNSIFIENSDNLVEDYNDIFINKQATKKTKMISYCQSKFHRTISESGDYGLMNYCEETDEEELKNVYNFDKENTLLLTINNFDNDYKNIIKKSFKIFIEYKKNKDILIKDFVEILDKNYITIYDIHRLKLSLEKNKENNDIDFVSYIKDISLKIEKDKMLEDDMLNIRDIIKDFVDIEEKYQNKKNNSSKKLKKG